MLARALIWASPDGSSAHVHISEALAPRWPNVLFGGGLKYDSLDMKAGIDTQALLRYVGVLKALVLLDPRGGFFGQRDMAAGVRALATMEEYHPAFESWRFSNNLASFEMGVTTWAYKLRVMLSHVRIKRNAYVALRSDHTHPPELVDVYNNFSDVPMSVPQTKKLCPFVQFRAPEIVEVDEDLGEDTDNDVVSEIMRHLSFEENRVVGKRLMSDGSTEIASEYCDEEGFALCRWEDGSSLATDIPSTYIAGDHIKRPDVPPSKPTLCKKPAARKDNKKIKKDAASSVVVVCDDEDIDAPQDEEEDLDGEPTDCEDVHVECDS